MISDRTLALAREHLPSTTRQLADKVGCTRAYARRVIHAMVLRGYAEQRGEASAYKGRPAPLYFPK